MFGHTHRPYLEQEDGDYCVESGKFVISEAGRTEGEAI